MVSLYSGSLLRLAWLLKETLLARRPLIDILSLNLKTVTKLTENEVFQPVLFRSVGQQYGKIPMIYWWNNLNKTCQI